MNYTRIRDLREDRDLKQEDIANMLNISLRQYGMYERGKQEIQFDKVIYLADYYDVSLDYIAGRSKNKKGLTKSELPDDVSQLVENFMLLSDRRKGQIDLLIKQLIKEQEEENAKIQDIV